MSEQLKEELEALRSANARLRDDVKNEWDLRSLAESRQIAAEGKLHEVWQDRNEARGELESINDAFQRRKVPEAIPCFPGSGVNRALTRAERIEHLADEVDRLQAAFDGAQEELAWLRGPSCRVCGCTELEACEGGCTWAEEELCSECVGKEPAAAVRTESEGAAHV